MLPVNDQLITEIEQILLPTGKTFDPERREFIKDLTTCDLKAVPGSGKTTVLLAKLMAIERQLPLIDGKAILVISHTNTAVDEIKKKISNLCPKLFSYPNFVGTIQGFVDEFLAIPYYCQKYGHKPVRIDNEIYNEKIGQLRTRHNFQARNWLSRRSDAQTLVEGLRLNTNFQLCDRKGVLFNIVGPTTPTYLALKTMKISLLEDGFLCFDDAYLLANLYMVEFPEIVQLIRNRFSIVFIDEMQDMDKHQHDLLEALFFTGNNSTIYQRIGDRNQSIFSDGIDEETAWTPRPKTLTIAGSNRLSPAISRIVSPFGLYDNIPITGYGPSPLLPHILLYDDVNPQSVLPYFANLVQEHRLAGRIYNLSDPVKAIGWVGKPLEANKTFINNYHDDYKKDNQGQKIDYSSLIGYLEILANTEVSYREARSRILSAFLKIFRNQGLKINGREYTKTQFLNELKTSSPQLLERLNLNLLLWCNKLIMEKNSEKCRQAIVGFIPGFLYEWKTVGTLHSEVISFLSSTSTLTTSPTQPTSEQNYGNVYEFNGLKIEVTTVHSVKGETHSATLYMETTYHKCESEKCLDQLKGNSATSLSQARKKEASKMMYVGFSRATCFFCFAAAKSRLLAHKDELERAGWEVLEIQEPRVS
ncbi:Superfamily I DNA or RNA helicase [Dyadobacter sp. SG02]|uniref:UvrD-helicase domain-containing protein n=1 Tax=Dyadobacter sp. SG02 TaxID=1855291 RepID=UPI0008C9A909|nr:UvrD-helicase domain-containing protein [Dyadobacter sp. SG02]SEJ53328.1 Superfamily I DNA or RNA helicase [Dyadobacter sp. SG02]